MKPPTANMTTFTDQKSSQDIATDPRSESEPKHDGLTTPVETENKRIPVPEQVESEQPKRGWKPVFLAEWLRGLFRILTKCETLIK
jgi:hypothetical protein